MNKSAIQKYAVWARNELIDQIKQRAFQYGISEEGYGDESASVIAGRVLSADEKHQRQAFIAEIKKSGFQNAVEEVAYTWFNRFVALRYMEVNDYLPTHVRVFSDMNGGFNPEILKDVLHLDLNGLDKSRVSELLNSSKTEELYRYLLLTQCNSLNDALPEMFEKLGSYTEMLLPNNILKPESVLGRLVTDIPEEDFQDAVQIIGWLYQYYNTEPKQAVFDGLKKNVKISKDKIPAATQLFTPDWIVRYMVENSLGRLWLESHPNDMLKANWKYYLEEAKQTPEVTEKLRVLRSQSPVKTPEDIQLIDPCMGSGHILVYAFDVLIQIYESEGYNPREAAKLILEKNIYGLDIDRRAYQLSYFSLMMKARQYNRRIFNLGIMPQVYHPAGFPDGEEFGSLLKVESLPSKPEVPKEITLFTENYETTLSTWNFKRLLAQKYDVVVTNPPYMGGKGQSAKTSNFLKENYPDTKSDTFSAFIERCGDMAKSTGYVGMFTPYVWMFITSYEELRKYIYRTKDIITLIQFEYSAFEEATVPVCTFVLRNGKTGITGEYLRLVDFKGGMEVQRIKTLEAISNPSCGYRYTASSENFAKIPGSPVAYWVSEKLMNSFEKYPNLGEFVECAAGISTGNNDLYFKFWYEVDFDLIAKEVTCDDQFKKSKYIYAFCNKGGKYRKWYGNNDYIANWKKSDEFHRNGATYKHLLFREGITWTEIGSGTFNARYYPAGYIFDHKAPGMFSENTKTLKTYLALLNSKVVAYILNIINPTVSTGANSLRKIPIEPYHIGSEQVCRIVDECINISRKDWDDYENSCDFNRHPLLSGDQMISMAFKRWKDETEARFNTLKANQEELNRIFLKNYELDDELSPLDDEKDVSVLRAFLNRDVRSLISYAVGCMFGRYSLDIEGLAYAGGEWDTGKYQTFIPDKDNIIPICDDEYFDDDIVGRFVDFVRVVYGEETLEENLKFIADALGGKGNPREVIRNYFLKDFYKDHCKIYQKRPIYWMFDSGKENGFKALIYLHRYSSDLLAKMRIDYVHEQQERYRTQLSHIDTSLNTVIGSERAKLIKQQQKLEWQLNELKAFEEKVHHLADQNIEIDLDDGVKKNYEIFADVLAKI